MAEAARRSRRPRTGEEGLRRLAVNCQGEATTELPDGREHTLTTQSTQGPTQVVEGYWSGDLKEAHDEYVKEFEAAGYKVLFEEVEEHDSEVSWSGEDRTGQVALRDDCGGDKIYVYIRNRPA